MTVFRSRPMNEARDVYLEHAERMAALAETMPGLLERKAFEAEDGERLTLVTFADRPSHDAWRDHPEHREAQRAGIERCYEYSIAVATTESASSFRRS